MPANLWRVRLGTQAELDLLSILRWTAQNFGGEQAKNYRATILLSIRELAEGSDLSGARKRDDIVKGFYSLHVARHGRRGRHLLLYQTTGRRNIEIVRILHDSVDLRRHVPDIAANEDT